MTFLICAEMLIIKSVLNVTVMFNYFKLIAMTNHLLFIVLLQVQNTYI